MKNPNLCEKIDLSSVLFGSDDKKTTYDIDVEEFDISDCQIKVEEELDAKLIKFIEGEVRHSFEYKGYINYLKNELELTKCSLLPGIDTKVNKVRLEFHHYPLTLFDITEAVGKHMVNSLDDGDSVSTMEIAERVVAEHYKNNVGLVPLTISMHKAAHNRSIFIPLDKVNGNYKHFILKYNDSISEEVKEKVKNIEISLDDETISEYNSARLEKNIINYNITYYKETENNNEEASDGSI